MSNVKIETITNLIANPDITLYGMFLTILPDDVPGIWIGYTHLNKEFDVCFPADAAWRIHIINRFLSRLNTGLKIEFNSYAQYADLIDECFRIYKALKTKEAQELLKIIEKQLISSEAHFDDLELIRASNGDNYDMSIIDAYFYGVMQGKRAERLKKKAIV